MHYVNINTNTKLRTQCATRVLVGTLLGDFVTCHPLNRVKNLLGHFVTCASTLCVK